MRIKHQFKIRDASPDCGEGDGVPKAGGQQAAADSRGSQGGKDELTSCRGTV